MKPTPEQYREAAVALILSGAPLEACSGPGEHVQFLTPPDDKPGAYVEVYVWVTEENVAEIERRSSARIAAAKQTLANYLESVQRLENMSR